MPPGTVPGRCGRRECDAAGLAEGDDPPPVEVEELVQRKCQLNILSPELPILHNCILVGPGWAGGAVEGGEEFDGGGD